MKFGNAFSFYHCVPVLIALLSTWGQFAEVDDANNAGHKEENVNGDPKEAEATVVADDSDSDAGNDVDEFGL